MRYHYTVTGPGPPPIGGSCGHAHATREEAQGCVRRGRSNIERVPVRAHQPSGCWLFGLAVLTLFGICYQLCQ